MTILFRLLMVVIGLAAATLAAGLLMMLVETQGLRPPVGVTPDETERALVFNTLLVAFMAAVFGFVPGFVVGVTAEIFRLRSFLLFVLAGAAIGASVLFIQLPDWVEVSGEPLTATPGRAYPAMGAVAGLVYWLVTGRRAGFSRPAQDHRY
jgi:hypothetical protein